MSSELPRGRTDFPLLPLKNVVVFPRTLVTLTVGRPRSCRALEEAVDRDRRLVVATQRAGRADEPSSDEIYDIGTLVEVNQVQRQNDGNLQVNVEGLRRVRIERYLQHEPCFTVQVGDIAEKLADGPVVEALMRHLVDLFSRYAQLNNKVPAEAVDTVRGVRHPGYLADLLAAHVVPDPHARQAVLEQLDQAERLERVGAGLTGELDVLELDQRIRSKVRSQIDKNQREFYLREQLKAIHDELGGEGGNELADLREKLEAKGLPDDVLVKLRKELSRLERMPSISPEGTVIRNYLDWFLAVPWTERTADVLDIGVAERVLDEDHYGLGRVKERILEFLAVRQLTRATLRGPADAPAPASALAGAGDPARGPLESDRRRRIRKGPILCFVGPPGVGKTSLGQSIADAMDRHFVRIALGGVHDEAEIRGHRRTYVGAMPGRIVQAMKTAGTRNPLILLDEIDKLASDYRGDPASALLEVLDPEQNWNFTDHYLDVPYDLSEVLFITTANNLHAIPRALRDRMEVIELSGYTEDEKVQIARRYLLPRQLQAHGLAAGAVEIPEKMLRTVIRTYTREAGVRDLERKLAAVCRKAARRIVQGRTTRVRLTPHNLEEYLGPGRPSAEMDSRGQAQIGVALGLAWTEHGGELLPVEVATMPGHGSLTITGRLGDVMQESARAALSYARSRAAALHIDPDFQEKTDLHIHLPEGAIPKDGPSAGITMASALISALTRHPLRHDTAMTGEITLRGRVLPIGGLKEKVLAAHRAGMKRVLAPAENRHDLLELPRNVRRDLEFIWVDNMDQVLEAILAPEPVPAIVPAPLLGNREDSDGSAPASTPLAGHPDVPAADIQPDLQLPA